jgi:hypothetical protein
MIKIKSKSNEFIAEEVKKPNENRLQFTVTGITDFEGFKKKLNKRDLENVEVYTGTKLTSSYEKFNKIVFPIGIEELEDGTKKVTVTLEQEDENSARLSALEDAVKKLIQSGLGAV